MLRKLEKIIIGGGIILMMVNSTANAIGRYVFNQSLFFSEEINQFLQELGLTIEDLQFLEETLMSEDIMQQAIR